MAVLGGVARVRIDDDVTHGIFREWVATASAFDNIPAGQSVDITITQAAAGAGAPSPAANIYRLNVYNDSGGLVRQFDLPSAAASHTVTLWMTADGTQTGAPRAGTLELAVHVRRINDATQVEIYNVESDGNPNTPGAGNDSHLDRGWLRAVTTATMTISNVALGGAKAAPAEYDESLFVRTTLGAGLFVARALTVTISGATPALSGATNSATTGPWDASFNAVVDDRFPAGITTVVTSLAVPNSTLTGQAFTVLTVTADSMTVDPRPDAESHLFQMDDDVFGTPPMSKHESSKSALVSSYSAIAFRLVRARTRTGINGLSTTITFDPRGAGANIVRSAVTANRGGQDGWTDLAQLGPFVIGGAWDVALTITAPTDIDAAGYVLNNTDVVVILASDPRIQVRGHVNLTTRHRGHFTAGDPIVINMTIRSSVSNIRIEPGRVTEPKVSFLRYRSEDDRLEYLDTDLLTWILWEPTAAIPTFDLVPSLGDARNYVLRINNTTSWLRDVTGVEFTVKVDGTPYPGNASREETSALHDHAPSDRVGWTEVS